MSHSKSAALPLEFRTLIEAFATAEVAESQRWILTLMRKQGLAVIQMLWRMLGAEADVLDAYQSAICQLTGQGERSITTNPAGYFYRCAMNAGIEILRARQQRNEHSPAVAAFQRQRYEHPSAACIVDQRETVENLRQAIGRLPQQLRSVIILHDLAEISYARVARILNIGVNTARLYRCQAVARLGDLMAEEARG
ncbi:MAG TPA: sigma-70 family RNA polymerase sigma factor [Phycisphaerae bacterium]